MRAQVWIQIARIHAGSGSGSGAPAQAMFSPYFVSNFKQGITCKVYFNTGKRNNQLSLRV